MNRSIDPPAPPLNIGGCLLRPFTMGDADAISQASRDPDIVAHTFMPADPREEMVRTWLERAVSGWAQGIARLAVVSSAEGDDRCLGQIGLVLAEHPAGNAEVFYWLLPEVRGRGWMTSALRAVGTWAFDSLQVERITALIDLDNELSLAAAERAGFVREGILRAYERVPRRGRVDLWSLSLLPSDIKGHPSS